MDAVYVFLIRNDVWIYILCGLGLLWYVTEFLRAQSALRRAMFGLERETSRRTRNNALVFILLFGSITAAVFYVNREVAPTLPPEMLRPPTPTPDPFALPAPTLPRQPTVSGLTPTSPIAATVTLPGDGAANPPAIPTPAGITATTPLTGTPTQTVIEGPPPTLSLPTATANVAGCAPNVTISDPRDGVTVVGAISIFGSATIPNFAYYELEIRGPQTNEQWASPLGRRVDRPVEEGFLGTVDLSQWAPGSYELRLTVVDTAGEISNRCLVTIILE